MIEEDTPIIPRIVADTVVTRVSLFILEKFECLKHDECDCFGCKFYAQKGELIDYLVDTANRVYKNNTRFAKLIRSSNMKGLEALSSFMAHWLVAKLKREYLTIFKMLPRGYGMLGSSGQVVLSGIEL